MDSRFCERCKKTIRIDQFYTSRNLEKYPDEGRLNQCKACITAHVDNWDPETFLWILQEIDIPYVPQVWQNLLRTYGKDPSKLTGATILGRYISSMRLKKWKDYRWKDTEFIQKLHAKELEEAMKQQGFSTQDIKKAVMENTYAVSMHKTYEEPEYPEEDFIQKDPEPTMRTTSPVGYGDDDLAASLTDDDLRYLRLKWGRSYKPVEWIELEQLYQQMMQSYDIQAAGDINNLKLMCKCSLKSNQLLDLGDIEGAQKATKMYDSLMKASKWTAAQIKEDESDAVDSIGEIVALCEKEGFIPKFYKDGPKDYIDRVEEDLKRYTRELVESENGLGDMMEVAVRSLLDEQERIREESNRAEEEEINKLFDYDNHPVVTIENQDEFQEMQEELTAEDEEYLARLLEEGSDLSAIS